VVYRFKMALSEIQGTHPRDVLHVNRVNALPNILVRLLVSKLMIKPAKLLVWFSNLYICYLYLFLTKF
jgi:hypothetical protein